jgi:hypothetical protein
MQFVQDAIVTSPVRAGTTMPGSGVNWASKSFELILGGSALSALLVAQWMLSSAIHGTNYDGGDGKMAQAIILAAMKFSGLFQVTTISPIEGIGSQLLPLNVWANPAFWPFHFLDRSLAPDASALIALMVFATACYVMTRCFDVGVIASAVAAQTCIVLFAPMVLVLQLPTVFCLTPGNAVAYAPHMVALGLLARLEPGAWRRIGLITVGIFAMMFYSLYCDPLWTMVNGISWSVAFAVIVLGPLRLKTIALRCAALGFCAIVLFLSGALEYLRTLSQYTARVQFPAVADRPRMFEFVSTVFLSPNMKHFYLACALGWLLGIVLLHGRARLFCSAAAMGFLCYVAYSLAYLLVEGAPWMPPIPIYVEQCLLPLYLAAGVAGYWGGLRIASQIKLPATGALAFKPIRTFLQTSRSAAHTMVQRARIIAVRHRSPRFARSLLPLSRLLESDAGPRAVRVVVLPARPRMRFAAIVRGLLVIAIIPAGLADFAKYHSGPYMDHWNEPWPNEPEVVAFFASNISRAVGQPIRGSVHFWTYNSDLGFTIITLWANAVHTIDEYSQGHAGREFRFHEAGRAVGAAHGDTGTGPRLKAVIDLRRPSPVRAQQRDLARCTSAAVLELSASSRRTGPHRTRRSTYDRRDFRRRSRHRHPVRLQHLHARLQTSRPRGHTAFAGGHPFTHGAFGW